MCLAVHTSSNPASVAARVRQELRDIDPNLPILNVTTVEQQLNGILVQERLTATMAGFFGVVAVLLACLGLYGVISYTVTRRTSEIGIRLALGATPGHVLRMVLKESLVLALAGIAIGVPIAFLVTRFISTVLFGVGAADPLTIAMAIALMIAVATLAALLPARRASRVDPLVAWRYE
jgi:ABC-type antimicrobial peptide transport system permease subunit